MLDGESNIVARAVAGEASAFGQLYDHYQPHIYRFVYFKVGRREEAEDLTHQVFMNALQRMNGYKNLGFPFSSWLYQIARNAVVDHYRSAKQLLPLDEDISQSLSEEWGQDRSLDERMSMQVVKTALAKLKPDYQDVIVLRFIEELSVKETAEAMGKTESSVKVLQHRALKTLKTMLPDTP